MELVTAFADVCDIGKDLALLLELEIETLGGRVLALALTLHAKYIL